MTTQNTYLTSSASSVLFLSDLGASENISLIFFSKSDFTFWRWWESSAFGCNSLPTSFSKIKIYYKLHIERGVHAGHSQPISSLKNYEILVSNVVRCKHHPAHPNQAVWILYTKKKANLWPKIWQLSCHHNTSCMKNNTKEPAAKLWYGEKNISTRLFKKTPQKNADIKNKCWTSNCYLMNHNTPGGPL